MPIRGRRAFWEVTEINLIHSVDWQSHVVDSIPLESVYMVDAWNRYQYRSQTGPCTWSVHIWSQWVCARVHGGMRESGVECYRVPDAKACIRPHVTLLYPRGLDAPLHFAKSEDPWQWWGWGSAGGNRKTSLTRWRPTDELPNCLLRVISVAKWSSGMSAKIEIFQASLKTWSSLDWSREFFGKCSLIRIYHFVTD